MDPFAEARYCPDCGAQTLELLEETAPDASGEYKEIQTCTSCDNLFYMVRGLGP